MHNNRIKRIKNRDSNVMPRKISEAGLNRKLRTTEGNISHTATFIREGIGDFELPNYDISIGYRLVKSEKKEQYRLITVGDIPETVYLVELKFRKDIILDRITCTQIKVWRTISSIHKSVIRELPSLFFAYLLDTYCIMLTDEEHTDDGRRFWESMIDWAFNTQYYVYASDGTVEDRPLTVIKNMNDFYTNWSDLFWGNDIDIHTNRLIAISKIPLISR
ncbi:hypothetical protein [Providencia sp.]|uniref:hypothetical protein n=1 Tax=Providencia sp. TaxID=589 RepID=UPI0030104D61